MIEFVSKMTTGGDTRVPSPAAPESRRGGRHLPRVIRLRNFKEPA
jgi:hypothetical protein